MLQRPPIPRGGSAPTRTARPPAPLRYLAGLSAGRLLLWCYLIWYLVVLVRYFDPSPRLWLTSLGISLIVGLALYVSTTASPSYRGGGLGFWPTARLFMMPLCVSSFSALVKGRDFVLVFSPRRADLLIGVGLCAAFCAAVAAVKAWDRRRAGGGGASRPAASALQSAAVSPPVAGGGGGSLDVSPGGP